MSNPHQELASPDQTVSGKDSSNPLMADNLPKIVWYSTHHVTLMKSWLVQKQTALGVNTPICDEHRLELMGLMVFLLPKVEKDGIGVNDVIRLQALVDKKKVVVTEATIREALRLDDAKGVECLLVRNVDSPSKFYMYPHFLQLMIRKQVGNLSTYTTKYTSPALIQKVFVNMRRVGKGFSEVETPLFEGMLVEQQVAEERDVEVHGEEVSAGDSAEGDISAAHGEVSNVAEEPSIPSLTPPTPPP
nr:hypothetical protein [Tanacetum cinerariifolium]